MVYDGHQKSWQESYSSCFVPSIVNHKQGHQKDFEEKPSSDGGIGALADRSRRWGQPRLLLYNRSPAAGLGHGTSCLLQNEHDEVLHSHLEEAVVLRSSPQEEPVVVFGADLLVIV